MHDSAVTRRTATSIRSRRRLRTVVCAAMATALATALTAAPASAVLDHSTIEREFDVGSDCLEISDIAIDEAAGVVYVSCKVDAPPSYRYPWTSNIKKFDPSGTPLTFSSSAPWLAGNEILYPPNDEEGDFGTNAQLAVDNSGANPGALFVTEGDDSGGNTKVEVFRPSGQILTSIPIYYFSGAPTRPDVEIGPAGQIYLAGGTTAIVEELDPAFHQKRRLYHSLNPCFCRGRLGATSDGALWLQSGNSTWSFWKFGSDAFSTNVSLSSTTAAQGLLAGLQGSPMGLFSQPAISAPNTQSGNFDVDLSDDSLYVNRRTRIEHYSGGTAEEPPHLIAPDFGALTDSEAVLVTADHRVYAGTGANKVIVFGPGQILPDIATPQPAVDDIGHTGATLEVEVDLDGGSAVSECKLEIGKTTAYSEPPVPCTPSSFGTDQSASAAPSGLQTGDTYHYRFSATNAAGTNVGIDRTFIPAYVLGVKTLPATISEVKKATLNGSLDPDGMPTTYWFQYGLSTSYGLTTPEASAGSGSGATPVDAPLTGLPEGRTWHYRLVAKNGNGTTIGADRVFRSVSAPDIGGVRATDVTSTSAVLRARIDPIGFSTQYHFEYGTTPEYTAATPAVGSPERSIGSGTEPVEVVQEITGLQPGVTHHFRVVASNQWGEGASSNTTFDFAPPSCPNSHVRQETSSSYLPDCRAYELVSPRSAGAVRLQPSHAVTEKGGTERWVLNDGRAVSPGRFTFWGELGSVSGQDAPNYLGSQDMYMATRTPQGWTTSLPGLNSREALRTGRHECSEQMDFCVDHDTGGLWGAESYSVPFLFAASGQRVGMLPTNVDEVPGGMSFTGSQRMSADFSHFVFSSKDVVFAEGGHAGGIGSAYSNDIEDKTVQVISKLANGSDIPQDGAATAIAFPGVSVDGSHVLMQTAASNGPLHLFMRVGGTVTYDVSRGAGVTFVGMTRDGRRVLFLAAAQLTPDDDDARVDLYEWDEAAGADLLRRVSQGNEEGNSEIPCAPGWGSDCDVVPLVTERGNPGNNPNVPGLDDRIAAGGGDVYFYSPELLDGSRPGIRDQRNLYVARDGSVRLVATLDPGTQIDRIQISTDGSYASFVTASRLTAYDNNGFKMMYTYDAETGALRCASCNPSGLPPSASVEASESGPFMTDDGRTFFTSLDALVDRDSNGLIRDVYEYVAGRPQLITTGTSAQDSTGKGGEQVLPVAPGPQFTGLEAVSRNGTDVYFSTFDTLVDQDHNGNFVKFYDARTGGGFPGEDTLASCAAADECHGRDSSRPGPTGVATSTQLTGGNTKSERPRRCKKGTVRRGKRCAAKGKRARRHRSKARGAK